MKYRCLVGGGEASRATSDDEKLFKEVCIAMTVSVPLEEKNICIGTGFVRAVNIRNYVSV